MTVKGPNVSWVDEDGTVHIQLQHGKEALVSLEDYPKVSKFRWFANRVRKSETLFYAMTHIKKSDGSDATVRMHTLIFEPGPGLEVDHIDGNGLDNRRGQARVVTRRENAQNLHTTRTSQYPGVFSFRSKWRSTIHVGKKSVYLGDFNDELSAAAAYRAACVRYPEATKT